MILPYRCPGGNSHDAPSLVPPRRRRRRHPRPLHRDAPRPRVAGARRRPGAGASGIACGVVRNNYFQPAMSELMQACVEVWESDPAAYHYNPVGYVALGAAVQEPDLVATYERQEQIGYRSELIVGAAEVDAHMKALFPDWRAQGVTACLHEHQGGFAFNMDSVLGLVGKCESEGVAIVSGVEVTGFEPGPDDSIAAV